MERVSRERKHQGRERPTTGPEADAGRPGAKDDAGATAGRASGEAASRHIDERIRSLGDWRGETLAEVRRLIREADPDVLEEWKWNGTPVWSRSGNVCTGEVYKRAVKLTFPRGASLEDPEKLFNSSLEGKTRRAIDIGEGEAPDAVAFTALIRAAIAENVLFAARESEVKAKTRPGDESGVTLLSGGNPQIAKADGDAPVQAYIAAMPGWKCDLGRRLDAIIMRAVPDVRKAVRWNSPFYGIEGRGWFLSFHVLTRYVKVTFFAGTSLDPLPPGGTARSKDARWIDIHEDDPVDEGQMTEWARQAAALPGWIP